MLAEHEIEPSSVLLVSHPYQQRRAFATCRVVWPDVDVLCVSRPLPLDAYVRVIGDADRVVDMLVGETQRLTLYAELGFISHEEDVPGRRRGRLRPARDGRVHVAAGARTAVRSTCDATA